MTENERIVFCFGVNGHRDDYHGNYHPASLYREGATEPYGDDADEADEMISKAFDALPKPPEDYTRDDAGRGSWVRFDYDELVSGGDAEPTQTTESSPRGNE